MNNQVVNPMMEVKKKSCHFCLEERETGIMVWGVFMCAFCEDELLRAAVGEERYMYYLEQLKRARHSCGH